MKWAGRSSSPVVQALRWLASQGVAGTRVVSILKHNLPDNVKFDLRRNSRDLPGCALQLASRITADKLLGYACSL